MKRFYYSKALMAHALLQAAIGISADLVWRQLGVKADVEYVLETDRKP